MNNIFCKYALTAVAAISFLSAAFQANAATPEEMERARAIAAQVYIRYTDDKSDYLDGQKPSSIGELRTIIGDNQTDRELLTNFLNAPVSNDYPNWGQAEMAEYWSGEFFANSGLSNKAADTRNRRIKARLLTMDVTPPRMSQPEEQPQQMEQPMQQPSEDLGAHPQEVTLGEQTEVNSPAFDTTQVTEESVRETREQGGSNTLLYIVLLVVLVGVVIGLVVYAMKAMRNQNSDQDDNPGSGRNMPRGYDHDYPSREPSVSSGEVSALHREIADLRRAESEARAHSEMLSARLGALQLEVQRLSEENAVLRQNTASVAPVPPRVAPVTPNSYAIEEEESIIPAERRYSPSVTLHAGPNDRVIYLGRANRNKVFIRADKQLVNGKSIYRLVSGNGITGSFVVDSDPHIMGWVALDPETALYGGAEVATFANASGASRIVTDAAGTAIFEDGCWRVLRPAAVHFE